MKILHVNTNRNSGAVPKIFNLIAALSSHQHFIFAPYEEGYWRNYINNNIRYLYALKARIFDCDGFLNSIFNKKIKKIITEENIDIIHLHNSHGYYLDMNSLIYICEERNIPIIWTLHDYWVLSGRCASPNAVSCNGYTQGCQKCDFINNYPKTWFSKSKQNFVTKRSLFLCKNIFPVCVSGYQKSIIERNVLFKNKITVIENGCALNYSKKPMTYEHQNKKIINIGFIANVWSEAKGLDDLKTLIEMAPNLLSECEIIVAGPLRFSQHNFSKNIKILGRLGTQNELNKFFSSIDVLVNLSKIDTLGMVNIEAFCNSVPVISRPIEPYLSLYRDLDIIKYTDSTQSLKAITELAKNLIFWCDSHSELANRQFEKIREIYSAKAMTNSYDRLYDTAQKYMLEVK